MDKPLAITQKAVDFKKLSLEEVILLLPYYYKVLPSVKKKLIDKGFIAINYDILPVTYHITPEGKSLIDAIIIDSIKDIEKRPMRHFHSVAEQLKQVYPKGKKPGTNYPWTESTVLIEKRLNYLFTKFNLNYTDEQIINATKIYVQSYQGKEQYMRLLKYFIFKGGDTTGDFSSDLLTYLEKGDEINDETTALQQSLFTELR